MTPLQGAEIILKTMKDAPAGHGRDGAIFPYDTGRLHESVRIMYADYNEAIIQFGGYATDASKEAPYARYVEFAPKLKGGKPNPNYHFVEKRLIPFVKNTLER